MKVYVTMKCLEGGDDYELIGISKSFETAIVIATKDHNEDEWRNQKPLEEFRQYHYPEVWYAGKYKITIWEVRE